MSGLVPLGDISYALYLWHWPLLVLAVRIVGDQLVVRFAVVGLSVLIAVVSTRFLESGFTQSRWPLWPIASGVLVLLVLVLATGKVGSLDVVRARVPQPESKWANFASRNSCGSGPEGWEQLCVFEFQADDDAQLDVFLFGDSNARSASDGVVAAMQDIGGRLTIGVMGACPFIAGVESGPTFLDECQNLNRSRRELLQTKPPDVLVMVNHVTNYMDPGYPGFNSLAQQLALTRETLLYAHDIGVPVLFQLSIPSCESNASILQPLGRCAKSTTDERDRLRFARELASTNAIRHFGVVALDLSEAICGVGPSCYANRGGTRRYSDPTHLSPTFSRELGPLYKQGLLEAASKTMLNP
jgi:hypothetical protein